MAYGMGPGVTGGMGAMRTSSPMNYGPSLAGGAAGFGNAWGGYYNQRAQQTGSQQDIAAAQRAQQQTAAMQQRQAAQDAATRRQQAAVGQGPSWFNPAGTGYAGTPMGDVARRPTQPAMPAQQPQPAQPQQTTATYTPAQQPAQAPTNPLLAALQGSPYAQGQTNTTVNALSRAIGGIGSAGAGNQNQEAFLQRLRDMLTNGSI